MNGLQEIQENIRALLEFTGRSERGANINQSWVELRTLQRKYPDVEDADVFYQKILLGETTVGQNYLKIKNNLPKLLKGIGKLGNLDQRLLLNWYNYEGRRGRCFENTHKIVKDLQCRWNRFDSSFRNKLGKVVFDFVEIKIKGKE